MFALVCIHLLRHESRGKSGTSAISFDLAITIQIIEVSSENIFTKYIWVKNLAWWWPAERVRVRVENVSLDRLSYVELVSESLITRDT